MSDDPQPERTVLEPLLPATFFPATPAIPATTTAALTPETFTPATFTPAIPATPADPDPGKGRSNLATPRDSGTPLTPTTSFPARSTNSGGGDGGGGSGSGASGPPVHIDTDLIALGIPQVTDFGNRITAIHATLMSTIGGLGEPWGDDENGAVFAESYLPARDQFDRGMTDTRTALDTTVDDINTTVRGYTETENGNTVPFNSGEN